MKDEISTMIAYAKVSLPVDPAVSVPVAGEPERIKHTRAIPIGIKIDENTPESLLAAAESVGLTRRKIAELQTGIN